MAGREGQKTIGRWQAEQYRGKIRGIHGKLSIWISIKRNMRHLELSGKTAKFIFPLFPES